MPLYVIGDTVLHANPLRSLYKQAKVEQVFESGDSYRYYVRHSGHVWSAPENVLFCPEEIQQVTKRKF